MPRGREAATANNRTLYLGLCGHWPLAGKFILARRERHQYGERARKSKLNPALMRTGAIIREKQEMNYLSIIFTAGVIASANGAYAFDASSPIIDLDRTAIDEVPTS